MERGELITMMGACADALCELGSRELDGRVAADELLQLDRLAGRLTSLAARLVPVVEADGWWAADGARSISAWLAAKGRMTYVRARQLVRLGRSFDAELTLAGDATSAGDLPLDHALALARHTTTTQERRDALDDADSDCGADFLVACAEDFGADTYTRLVKSWAAAADPAADERGYVAATDREFVTLAETTGGMYLRGFLTMDHGASLRSALESVMTPPAKDDTRTTAQRRGQAVADLARLALDNGLVGTGADVRPHLTCVVDFDSLRRAVDRAYRLKEAVPRSTHDIPAPGGSTSGGSTSGGSTSGGSAPDRSAPDRSAPDRSAPDRSAPDRSASGSSASDGSMAAPAGPGDWGYDLSRTHGPPGGEPAAGSHIRLAAVADIQRFAVAQLLGAGTVPASVLARLACDSELTRVVFGSKSQVIDVGRAERTFTGPRRRAVIARDQTCRYPTCTAPPALGEVHHVEHWARGGSTDTNTGVLLCWYHHDLVHRLHIEITRSTTGGWTFTSRHGTELPRAA